MKILIVMAGFFPGKKYGGPPVSIDNFCSLLSGHHCCIITSNHDLGEDKAYEGVGEGWLDRGNCRICYLGDRDYRKKTFEEKIKEIKPDIIYLQGLFQSCVVPCLQLAKKYNVRVLLAPRGELCAGALNLKKYKKIPYMETVRLLGLTKGIHWQSTSDEETEAIIRWMKADSRKIHRLENIPSIPKRPYARKEKIAGEGKFVFLSRIHPKKNLLAAIQLFDGISGHAVFDIYGPIEDAVYWESCRREADKLGKNASVRYKGLVSHDQVHDVFSQYDAFVFPTLSENFGHVIAESMFVGTTVIISDQTPWNDVNDAGVGWAIDLRDEQSFRNAVQTIIDEDEISARERSNRTIRYITDKMNIAETRDSYGKVLREIRESR